jgi:hypothetical protein
MVRRMVGSYLHLRGGMVGDVIVVRGHRNVIVCRIADQPPLPVSCGDGMKDEDRAESCDPSLELDLESQLDGLDENACFTPPINSSSCIALATTTHKKKYLAP